MGIGVLSTELHGVTSIPGTWATHDAGAACRAVAGRRGIEPEHFGQHVIPEGEDEDHTTAERLAHGSKSTFGSKVIMVVVGLLLSGAHLVGDGIASEAGHIFDS